MAFKVDNQTINDLKIIGDNKGNDIYSLFNKTKTRGGAKILKDMFLYPRSRAEEITNRVQTIQFFKEEGIPFPFNNAVFDTIEFYLSNTDERTKLNTQQDNAKRKFNNIIGSVTEYKQINKGVSDTLEFFINLNSFILQVENKTVKGDFHKNIKTIKSSLNTAPMAFLKSIDKVGKLSYAKTAKYDQLFRFTIRKDILKLLHYAYEIDVLLQ